MFQAFIISAILLIIGVLILGFRILKVNRIFFIKDGTFPNIHIGANQGLKDKGVACATTQDREAQKNVKPLNNNDLLKEITNKL